MDMEARIQEVLDQLDYGAIANSLGANTSQRKVMLEVERHLRNAVSSWTAEKDIGSRWFFIGGYIIHIDDEGYIVFAHTTTYAITDSSE